MWLCSDQSGKPARWRDFHSATGISNKMYIFGGRSDRAGPYHTNSELYCPKIQVFDTINNTWFEPQAVGNVPCGRRSHSACMLVFTVVIYSFNDDDDDDNGDDDIVENLTHKVHTVTCLHLRRW